MRKLTFAFSALLFLPLLSVDALASPVENSQSELEAFPETEIKDRQTTTENNPTVTADNTGWSDNSHNEIEDVKLQLQNIRQRNFTPSRGIPSLTIANPYGFGADRGLFSGLSYQFDNRNPGVQDENNPDATFGFGTGFGNAQKSVGVELSYSMVSFGQSRRDFGSGGFNLKLHRKVARGWGVSAGWNSFLSVGDANDLEDSLYLSTTKIFSLREKVTSPLSRVGVTIGVGNGQFRNEDDIADDNETFNIFGSLAFRVARPVSFITEWTGQDLALGLSASPFRTIPLTVNLAARDIAGAGDEIRWVLGVGTNF